MIDTEPAPAPLAETTLRGLAVYEERLKPLLEPDNEGHVVAIHVETGDHEVARFSGDAFRRLKQRHPSGEVLLHTIGRGKAHPPRHRQHVRPAAKLRLVDVRQHQDPAADG